MPCSRRASLMLTTAVPDGSNVTLGRVYFVPLLRYRIGATVSEEIPMPFFKYIDDLKFASVIHIPPTIERRLAGLGQGLGFSTRGATGLCGASTFGCWAARVAVRRSGRGEVHKRRGERR